MDDAVTSPTTAGAIQSSSVVIESPAIQEVDSMKDIFEADGFLCLRQHLPTNILQEWQSFSEEYFCQVFRILHRNGHTAFATHCRQQQQKQQQQERKEYALGLGIKNGFREVVMRSPGRYEMALFNAEFNTNDGRGNDNVIPASADDDDDDEEQAKLSLSCLHFPSTITTTTTATTTTMPCSINAIQEHLARIVPSLLDAKEWNEVKVCSISLLISTPDSPQQGWHADGGHLSLDHHLPCHCLNVFIPLSRASAEMGPTEIRPGTHFHTRNLAPMMLAAAARKSLRPAKAPILEPGDVLIFDYRVLHRGKANLSLDRSRIIMVLTVAKTWFKDLLNFPSKSIFEKSIDKQKVDNECK